MDDPPVPLDSLLWARLYGPYGVQDVVGELRALRQNWDVKRAENLFWEMLHHQEDLYPVTYAALPWIWLNGPKSGESGLKMLLFVSWVIYCALRDAEGGDMARDLRLVGLSQILDDHQHRWLKPEERLRTEDMDTLADLKTWFLAAMPEINEVCLAAATSEEPTRAAYLLSGPLAGRGARSLAFAVTMFADGESDPEIEALAPAAADPAGVAAYMAARLDPGASGLKAFLMRRANRL